MSAPETMRARARVLLRGRPTVEDVTSEPADLGISILLERLDEGPQLLVAQRERAAKTVRERGLAHGLATFGPRPAFLGRCVDDARLHPRRVELLPDGVLA